MSRKPQGPSRFEWLDIAKGLLMTTVIFGHAIQFIGFHGRADFWLDPIFKAIYMFHMPLFMAYSGYVAPLRRLNMTDLASRAQTLVYPMIFWSIAIALFQFAAKRDPLAIPHTAWTTFIGMYWFLWCAFAAYILMWAAQREEQLAPAIYITTMASLLLFPLPWRVLNMLTFILPFFIAGQWFRTHPERIAGRSHWLIVTATFASTAAYVMWDKQTYVYNNLASLNAGASDVLLMFSGASAATILAAYIFKFVSLRILGTTAGNWFRKLGNITLETYIVQGVSFSISGYFSSHIPGAASDIAAIRWLVSMIVTLGLTICIPWFVTATRRSKSITRLLWGK